MKNIIKTFLKIVLIIAVIIVMLVAGIIGATLYKRWQVNVEENNKTNSSGDVIRETKQPVVKEECFTCLFMGVNGTLTDFIMLGQYNPNTRDISLISIPRDTNVSNSVDGKINSLYGGKYPDKTVAAVEKITGVDIQHYVVFDTKILRNIVDEIGGVTVDVPINMNYDDPAQSLYIHLNKGTQVLNGKKAEQFVRFRKNNDGTGYVNGDVDRIKTQQSFIKAMLKEILTTSKITKIGAIVKIAIEGTKTDITMEIASKYIDDAALIDLNKVRMETLPGSGRYGPSPFGYNLSYFYHDEAKTKTLIDEMFNEHEEENSGDSEEIIDTFSQIEDGKIRIELLNANSNMTVLNSTVEKLNDVAFDVVKIGNYSTTENETSRIIDYGTGTTEELELLKSTLKINKVVSGEDNNSKVKYSVIIGQNYK